MLKCEGIEYFLCKLRSGDETSKKNALKEMTDRIQAFNTHDLRLLLEFLTTISDISLEVKLFAFLAICITTNDIHYETVATYNPIYGKVEATLSRGLPLKSATILNFVTVLVYTQEEESMYSKRKTLAAHARNSIRVSGCLGVMTSFFANSMMFPDTWKALCQCIAECCRDSDINKTQCGHLISLCVQKVLQGFDDAIMVLQSIVNDHPRNVQLFLSCNGTQIFSRDMLQNLKCLQLLAFLGTIPQASSLIRNTNAADHVSEILHWNGPHSQKGQWCTVIMYYLGSQEKQPKNQTEDVENGEHNRVNSTAEQEADAEAHSAIEDIIINDDTNHLSINQTKPSNDDTTKLFRNVVKEILYWKSKEKEGSNDYVPKQQIFTIPTDDISRNKDIIIQPGHPTPFQSKNHNVNFKVSKTNTHQRMKNYHQSEERNEELSFSFLQEEDTTNTPPLRKHKLPDFQNFQKERPSRRRQSELVSSKTQTVDQSVKYLSDKYVQTNFESTSAAFGELNIQDEQSTLDSKQFKPSVVSTPKMKRNNYEHKVIDKSLAYYSRQKKRASSCVPTRHIYKERRKKVYKTIRKSSPVKLTTRSMSARLFNAINESCTTLVKTVKNVFTTEKKDATTSKIKTNNDHAVSRGYSFMDYMRKRDAMLGEDYIGDNRHYPEKCDESVKEGNLCKTCNDTAILKQKLNNNEYLKKTLKKLKLGINLFGCDFNKISKTFWPQEAFMSPTVLYNLYRKLILK